jgi:tungstate transport system ATP-binding protein
LEKIEKILQAKDLVKYYDQKKVLDIEDVTFEKGKVYALLGPNGAGKTTLLSILALIETPTSGEIYFKGKRIDTANTSSKLDYRRRVGVILQDPYLFSGTVLDNVLYGLKLRRIDKDLQNKKAYSVLERLNLKHLAKKDVKSLSAGEAQRVALARSMVLEPEVFLLDEFTSSIDRENVTLIEEIIDFISKERDTTVIFTTHDLSQAHRLADVVFMLDGGRLIASSIENLFVGRIEEENGLKRLNIDGKTKILLTTEKTGKAKISIDPKDIILSSNPFKSSARNCLYGRLIKIMDEDPCVRLFFDVNGVEFVVLITWKSFKELDLSLGCYSYLTFKASSVKLL